MRSGFIDGARRKAVALPGGGNWFLPLHPRILVITSHSLLKQRLVVEISLSVDFRSGTVVLLSSPFLGSGVSEMADGERAEGRSGGDAEKYRDRQQ